MSLITALRYLLIVLFITRCLQKLRKIELLQAENLCLSILSLCLQLSCLNLTGGLVEHFTYFIYAKTEYSGL